MDKVFVSGGRKPRKNKRFSLPGFGAAKRGSYAPVDDDQTEYFPYGGGSGVDEFAYKDNYLSYEPADILEESSVKLEPPTSLSRNVRRVLARGSKYDVYEAVPEPEPEPVSEEVLESAELPADLRVPVPADAVDPDAAEEIGAPQEIEEPLDPSEPPAGAALAPPSPSGPDPVEVIAELLSLEWLDSIPLNAQDCIAWIRSLARASLVLAPLDMYADGLNEMLPGTLTVLVGVELFVLMLIGYALAKILELLCLPAVLHTHLGLQLLS